MSETKVKEQLTESQPEYIDYLIHELISYWAHKPKFDKQNLVFTFSLLNKSVVMRSERDFNDNCSDVLAKIDPSYNPTFRIKPFKIVNGKVKFKHFGLVRNYTVYELHELGFPVFTKEDTVSVWLNAYNCLYNTIRDYASRPCNINIIDTPLDNSADYEFLRYRLKPSFIHESIESFRWRFNPKSNYLPLKITRDMSIAMAHSNANDWIKSFDEFYSVLFSQEKTYNVLNDNPDLEDNVIRLTRLVFDVPFFNNWLCGMNPNIKSFSETQISLNSETINYLLLSQTFRKYVFRKYQNFSNVTVRLNNQVSLTSDWIRFISVFQHAGGHFSLISPEALQEELIHVDSLLELFEHSTFCDKPDPSKYDIYQMFEFRDVVKEFERLGVTAGDKFERVLIRRYVRGQFYSMSDIALLKHYNIYRFEHAPLTLYNARKRQNELVTIRNICDS